MFLYKKYKKYNSIYNKPKNCRNILNKFKSNENSYSSTKNYLFYPLNTHIKNLKSLYNDNHDKKDLLSYISKNSKIPILTSINDNTLAKLTQNQRKLIDYDLKASNIYSFLNKTKLNQDYTNML